MQARRVLELQASGLVARLAPLDLWHPLQVPEPELEEK